MTTTLSLLISNSIFTLTRGTLWHIGISDDVFFAAIIPATLAVFRTSPFGVSLFVRRIIVSGFILISPRATAVRFVADFSPTSTIFAPFSST